MALSDDNAGQINERHIDRKTPVVVAATTRTLSAADADNTIVFTAAGATTVTVPTEVLGGSTIPRGSVIKVATTGAGGLTIAGAGVTFTGAALTGAQNVTKEIVKLSSNAWFCLR